MNPDDERHGTYAGYIAGCRCPDCGYANYRADKERKVYSLTHGSCRVGYDQVREVVEPWLLMGLTLSAVHAAAGLGGDSGSVHDRWRRRRSVNRNTFSALAAVGEEDFSPSAKVFSDLTRKRIYSLMAAGHPLRAMPITYRGAWRDRKYVTVEVARSVRGYYRNHEARMGPSVHTAARARNAGHEPPLAWDDPDTLAWPKGVPEALIPRKLHASETVCEKVIDEVAVQRAISGDRTVRLTLAERVEAIENWSGSDAELERLTGWNVARDRRRIRKDGAA